MNKIDNIFVIPCKVNSVPMNFIFDTGASDVSISITEAKFLIKNGLLGESDIKENQKYTIANGEIIEGTKINLKVIEIGDKILENITATVIHQENAPLLLGQSAISKLGAYSINDNKLIFGQVETENTKKNIHLLDEKFGYRNINFDTEFSKFSKLTSIGSNNSSSLYEFEPLEGNLKSLYNVDFHKLLLGFNNSENKLEAIILLKRYQSNASSSPKKTQEDALDEFQNLAVNFVDTLGKPTNIEDLEKETFYYEWESEKVILRVTFKTEKYELDDNGNLKVDLSNTVFFSKKKENKGF